eukprot:TRINITY_DN4820_c0_g1_i1.p1 TRINITY_DN4820_c0_g1~~TRINITY_DN4820_c0_g1_i1.p1  ORF type:complete len:328 (-),score=49.53 TRINITY_DN4820_c0_g1_i1:670-1653(-)
MGQTTSRDTERGLQRLRLSGWHTEEGGGNKHKAPVVVLSDGTQITLENLCGLYEACFGTKTADEAKCLQVIECNFDRLLCTKERRHTFFALSKDALISILKSDSLHSNNEYRLLLLVAAWSDAQLEIKRSQEAEVQKEAETKRKEEGLRGPTDIDLRGTAGFFQQMTQGAKRHLGISEEEEAALIEDLLSEDCGETTSADGGEPSTDDIVVIKATEDFDDMIGEDEMGELLNTEGVEVPKWKLSETYQTQLRALIADFCPYIRFPLMGSPYLQNVAEEGFVPHYYCHEAIRFQALMPFLEEKQLKELEKTSDRFRSRGVQFFPIWHV